jgi:hypothetical protein
VLATLATPTFAQVAPDAATPGEIAPEPSTPTTLAVRWPVVGDANANAVVAVSFRKRGTPAWMQA